MPFRLHDTQVGFKTNRKGGDSALQCLRSPVAHDARLLRTARRLRRGEGPGPDSFPFRMVCVTSPIYRTRSYMGWSGPNFEQSP